MAKWYETSLFGLEEVGVQVQIPAGLLPVFCYCCFIILFSFIVFLPFDLFPFILTAGTFKLREIFAINVFLV